MLAQCLAAGELDDTVDIIGAIDAASPATRAAVDEVKRVRIASGVAAGGKFGGGRWRRVGPWVDGLRRRRLRRRLRSKENASREVA